MAASLYAKVLSEEEVTTIITKQQEEKKKQQQQVNLVFKTLLKLAIVLVFGLFIQRIDITKIAKK